MASITDIDAAATPLQGKVQTVAGWTLTGLFTALMGGTAGVHLVNGNPWPSHILFGPYLAVFAWAGLWLRDADLRRRPPIRR